MNFTKFTIEGFRCFIDKQSLELAQPKDDKIGSGITYIVGSNNSGKTTILEGLAIRNNDNINSSDRIAGSEPRFLLYKEDSTLASQCAPVRAESHLIQEDPLLKVDQKFEIVSSRRYWTSNASQKYQAVGLTVSQSHKFQKRQSTIDVPSELRAIETDQSGKYEAFISLVQKIIPEFTKFTVGYEDHEYIEYLSKAGIRHKTDLLGDGVISVIRILLHLYCEERNNPLIIDEPELSLHPQAQKKLLGLIAGYAQKRQIIISTHSPYFIRWEYIANGAKLNRVVKANDEKSEIFHLNDPNNYASLINGANWQQPYLMDEVAKEIFFAQDNILFLEGQDDVGLLRDEFLNTEIQLFGYGVRGCGNFKFALTMAKDLGFKKVAVILDNGDNEKEISNNLTKKFPNYKIIQWNKNDIRDKPLYTSEQKIGYFDKDGKKKEKNELDDFDVKIDDIRKYFEPELPAY